MEMKIIWLEPALQHAQEIFDYYKYEAGERTARKIVQKLYARPEVLVKNPHIGRIEPSLEGGYEEFRYLTEGHHKIIYYIDGDEVLISTIFDTRRNPATLRKIVVKAEA
jgi:plasmid stabilization system protein ParE